MARPDRIDRYLQVFFLLLALCAGAVMWAAASWALSTWRQLDLAESAFAWIGFALQVALTVAAAVASLFFGLAAWPEGDPLRDPHWRELFFREHPRRRLETWARSLRYFRYVRGSGGGMDDHGDCLMVVLETPTFAVLLSTLRQLGARAEPEFSDPAVDGNVRGQSSRLHIGETQLIGYVNYGRLELSLTDPAEPWAVSQRAVDSARSLEPLIEALADRLVEPPVNSKHCLCPRYYPSFWRQGGESRGQ